MLLLLLTVEACSVRGTCGGGGGGGGMSHVRAGLRLICTMVSFRMAVVCIVCGARCGGCGGDIEGSDGNDDCSVSLDVMGLQLIPEFEACGARGGGGLNVSLDVTGLQLISAIAACGARGGGGCISICCRGVGTQEFRSTLVRTAPVESAALIHKALL